MTDMSWREDGSPGSPAQGTFCGGKGQEIWSSNFSRACRVQSNPATEAVAEKNHPIRHFPTTSMSLETLL